MRLGREGFKVVLDELRRQPSFLYDERARFRGGPPEVNGLPVGERMFEEKEEGVSSIYLIWGIVNGIALPIRKAIIQTLAMDDPILGGHMFAQLSMCAGEHFDRDYEVVAARTKPQEGIKDKFDIFLLRPQGAEIGYLNHEVADILFR